VDTALSTVGSKVRDDAEWYVQKGSRVLGPFSSTEIGRFLLLGRVRNSDRVSRDGELWEPVTQVPELVPEELLDLDNGIGWARFLDERAASDERVENLPVDVERRVDEDMAARLRDEWSADDPTSPPAPSALPWTLLAITLAALGVVLWVNGAGSP